MKCSVTEGETTPIGTVGESVESGPSEAGVEIASRNVSD